MLLCKWIKNLPSNIYSKEEANFWIMDLKFFLFFFTFLTFSSFPFFLFSGFSGFLLSPFCVCDSISTKRRDDNVDEYGNEGHFPKHFFKLITTKPWLLMREARHSTKKGGKVFFTEKKRKWERDSISFSPSNRLDPIPSSLKILCLFIIQVANFLCRSTRESFSTFNEDSAENLELLTLEFW